MQYIYSSFFQPKYVLRKGEGHSTFQFTKIVERMQAESKINQTLKTFGDDMMAPVTAHLNKKGKHRKVSRVGEMARRVARKASHLSTSIKNTHLNSVSNFSNSKHFLFQVCSYSRWNKLNLLFRWCDKIGYNSRWFCYQYFKKQSLIQGVWFKRKRSRRISKVVLNNLKKTDKHNKFKGIEFKF